MTTTPAELEARVRNLELRHQRTDEDLTALMDTVLETREDVKVLRRDVGRLRLDVDGLTRRVRVVQNDVDWLKRGVQALLVHQGLTVGPIDRADESDGPSA